MLSHLFVAVSFLCDNHLPLLPSQVTIDLVVAVSKDHLEEEDEGEGVEEEDGE